MVSLYSQLFIYYKISVHKRNRKTLQRHLQLVELLEVPQLVDACSRNGFHDEALELASFVNSLERKHILATEVQADMKKHYSGSNSVIQSIVDDVQQTLLELRKQLFLSLTESCSLPRQLYFLGVLRKLDGLLIDRQLPLALRDNADGLSASQSTAREYRSHIIMSTETRLQMDFLECRSIWLEKISASAIQPALKSFPSSAKDRDASGWDESPTSLPPSSGSGSTGDGLGHYGRAIEVIEVNRTAWFEVMTHFSALFQDVVGSVPSVSILSSWSWTQYRRFTADLFAIVSKIEDGPSIKSILEQCLLFASRMSSLGCDFTEDIVAQFGDVVLKRFSEICDSSLDRFETMLVSERFVTESDGMRREHVIPLYMHNSDQINESDTPGSTADSSLKDEKDAYSPPRVVMSFPSLAHLSNGILTAINFLKDCPLLDIKESALRELLKLFRNVSQLIEKEAKRIRDRGTKYRKIEYDKSTSQKLDEILSSICLTEIYPHALRCYVRLYPTCTTPALQMLSPLQAAHDKLFPPPVVAAPVTAATTAAAPKKLKTTSVAAAAPIAAVAAPTTTSAETHKAVAPAAAPVAASTPAAAATTV
jgi:hypothetical protein